MHIFHTWSTMYVYNYKRSTKYNKFDPTLLLQQCIECKIKRYVRDNDLSINNLDIRVRLMTDYDNSFEATFEMRTQWLHEVDEQRKAGIETSIRKHIFLIVRTFVEDSIVAVIEKIEKIYNKWLCFRYGHDFYYNKRDEYHQCAREHCDEKRLPPEVERFHKNLKAAGFVVPEYGLNKNDIDDNSHIDNISDNSVEEVNEIDKHISTNHSRETL